MITHKIVDVMKDLHPIRRDEMIKYSDENGCTKLSQIRKHFSMVAAGKCTIRYWTDRGHSLEDAKKLRIIKPIKVGISPFTIEHWTLKGFSEEEAKFKVKSCRKIHKEYWISRGYSEEDGTRLAKSSRTEFAKSGADGSKHKTLKERREISPRSIEYWIKTGYSKEESVLMLKSVQTTFSLKKCVEKYGDIEGNRVWQNRQFKWLKTLDSKSEEEKNEINLKKSAYKYSELRKKYTNNQIRDLMIKRNMFLCTSLEDFNDSLQKRAEIDNLWKYRSKREKLFSFSKLQRDLLNLNEDYFDPPIKHEIELSNGGYYTQKTEEGFFLKSSYEIDFYNMLKKNNVEFLCNKPYPDKKSFYDFFIISKNIYIEISPNYNNSIKTKMIIDAKIKKYKCVVLKTTIEMEKYVNDNFKL